MNFKNILYALSLCCFSAMDGQVQSPVKKEIQYLSGTDVKHTKTWDFWATAGRKSGVWTSIEVPGHWEQQGFGGYNYGRDNVTNGKNFRYHDEKGFYKYQFNVTADWKNKDVYIVFEGSMTDTEVKINGDLAGKVHQGAFYRFKYNIGDKLKFGQKNELEVLVSKMSADKSVNGAERLADYWIFGGIFRPVYLEALPKENISWTSIDAKADGSFSMNVHLNTKTVGRDIIAEIIDSKGKVIGKATATTSENDSVVNVKTSIKKPLLWSAESPNLYSVKVSLKKNADVLYETSDKFGFRTIEVRKEDGIYLNGTKIKIKGVNRHVFWPEYGRATYPEADLIDVKLIKEMNMNAVRCSHYPPDENFLRVCDSLGLYVIDELAGWQKAYSTKAGEPLVKEMVIRDANHPSIFFWSNGNEGGHNFDFDDDFAKYDLSNRTVIHAHHKPGNAINGIDCNHYEGYYSTQEIVKDTNIYMPTEFLHAMQDGGAGAGLADMWELHWNSKKGAGGFIWDFADEGIVRTDLNNFIDVNGNNAADGIVGPHREKERSFDAIREIYSPIHITFKDLPEGFKGEIPVENRYHFTNLNQCTFQWELINFNGKQEDETGHTIIKQGTFVGSNIAPVTKGTLKLSLPADWENSDALALKAIGADKNEIYRWVWKIKSNADLLEGMLKAEMSKTVSIKETDVAITLSANAISVSFSKETGELASLKNENGAALSFGKGPVMVSGTSTFSGLKHFKEADAYVIEASYSGDLKYVRWKMQPTGWLEMDYEYTLNGVYPFAGISFSYPQGLVIGAKWLGKGPGRVWKNRLQGVTFDVYQNQNNATQTGSSPWIYPEFKGYFSEIVWMELSTLEGKFTVASTDKDLFVRLFDFYGINGNKPHPQLPTGDISFLDAIPAVGSKMGINDGDVKKLGPNSELNHINEPIKRSLYFYFGTPKIKEQKEEKLPK
ncbi:glycoside hydrolase family 2 protein [Flavobacterium sp. HJJ]|uniref:glycoside hydrolase family 2 protein n=1 Tax=Flavobacterium sp. HJJ TaxID=2783792 RepID=UPI001889E428|nr:glycoside hydrolase family 2 TIM barrel-domain containing protein [Flavobacterium sp. HJJ]MBF4473019.1 glycoside hydrolase family 2 [Flavobacterium sp. HJJ]